MDAMSSPIHPFQQQIEGATASPSVKHTVKRDSIAHISEAHPFFSTSQMLQSVRRSLAEDKDIPGNPSVKGTFDLPELEEERGEVDRLSEADSCIQRDDLEGFKKILDNLERKDAALLVQKLLKRLAGSSETYEKVADFLIKKYDLSSQIAHGDKGKILTLKGMEKILSYLTAKGSMQMECRCCESHAAFKEALETIKTRTDDFRMGFFMQDEHPFLGGSLHITPIYIERVNGKFRAVITDSTGNAGKFSFFAAMAITAALEIKPLSYGEKRQFDYTNCPIFSLRDMVHISRNPNFYNECAAHIDPQSSTKAMDQFYWLPPSMMKVTQRLNVVRDYIEDTQDKQTLEPLNKALEKHKETLGDREINTLVPRRYKKYERIIIAKAIANGIEG